ncbi:Prolamin-like domain [Sesbania bispinosa]|nr:Prolamin-like domain [Sesbania bispinosa]
MALKHGLFLLTLACFVAYGTATRGLLVKRPTQDIAVRLQGKGGDLISCWKNLIELKSCSNEIVQFFTNGEPDIGPNCCCAITMITHNCWPAMITSLGFTAQEGHYLRGYCDASASSPALAPATDGAPIPIKYLS